jgi:hypothetical protein
VLVQSEGEINFLNLLHDHLKQADNLIAFPKKLYSKSRLDDLDIPSPYLVGLFDDIVAENPDVVWAATLETNRGCPFACTFCEWGTLTYSKVKKFYTERIEKELDWMSKNKVVYIMTGDANFGIFKERDLAIAQLIMKYAEVPGSKFETLHMNYTKNGTDIIFEIGKVLRPLMREGITISVQSMHQPTLESIKRNNLDINKTSNLLQLSEQFDIPTYTELIIGLPEETLDSWKQGLSDLLEIGQHSNIDIWWAQLLNNSEMNTQEYKKRYGIKSVVAEDYLTFRQSNEDYGYPELVEIVNQTSTMTTEDLIIGYLYGWMIIHFHITGYSQIYARYLRAEHNISYRKYYDTVFEQLQQHTVIKEHFDKLYNGLVSYLQHGKTKQLEYQGHAPHRLSYEFFYSNRASVDQVLQTCVEQCGIDLSDDIVQLQQNFIYDKSAVFPKTIQSKLNLENFLLGKNLNNYVINSQVPTNQQWHLQMFRKRGWLKNKFTKKLDNNLSFV